MENKIKTHFLNLYSFALSDSNVTTEEALKIYEIGLERGIPKTEIDNILDNPHKVHFTLPEGEQEIIEQLIDIAKIIMVDDHLDVRELKSLREFIRNFIKDESIINTIIEELVEGVKKKLSTEELISVLLPKMEG